jgi:4-amino-4-deoxy-L-arabinose transferase-like glycosyltransferase
MMLPICITRGWLSVGGETVAVPILIGMLFTFGTVVLLFSAVSLMRNEVRGFLAGAVLMGTPLFIIHGARQHADIPLAFFILATVVLICLQDRLKGNSMAPIVLAGITGGLAAWTKNEGLLFLVAVVMARFATALLRRDLRAGLSEAGCFLAGLTPVLAIIICFKMQFAPPNDLAIGHDLSGLAVPSRYYCIAKEFLRRAFTFGRWQELGPVPFNPMPLLLGYLLCFGVSLRKSEFTGVITSCLALSLLLAGYFVVYLLTPIDLKTHLETSCDRLFLQIWPALVFLCFMAIPSPMKQVASETSH